MNANFFYAEVVETPDDFGTRFKGPDNPVPVPEQAPEINNLISVRPLSSRNSSIINGIRPFNKYGFTVPIIGEIVLVCTGPGEETDTLVYDTQYYYLNTVNIFNNQNINPTPGTYWFKAANDSRTEQFDWNVGKSKSSPSWEEEDRVSSLQPYEGDIIFSSRFGSGLRFSTSWTKGRTEYSNKPCGIFQGSNKSPITILSNGWKKDGDNKTVNEDFDATKSLIVLTSDQKLPKFKSAQSNLGVVAGVQPSSVYSGAQIVITSDRLVFNSKKDEVILSAKKTVTVATPNWAMDLDSLFTVLEDLISLLQEQASASPQYQYLTGTGPMVGAPGAVPELTLLLAQLKAMRQ